MAETERQRISRIFRHLKALDESRSPVVRQLEEHAAALWWRDLPQHPAVVQGAAQETEASEGLILTVTREKVPCPLPPPQVAEWVKEGWSEPDSSVETISERDFQNENGVFEKRFLHDDPDRLRLLEEWLSRRVTWARAEIAAEKLRERLGELHRKLELQGDGVELMLGDALFECPEPAVRHPLLLQEVSLEHDADADAYTLRLSTEPPDLYTAALSVIEGIDEARLVSLAQSVAIEEFAPLDASGVAGFLTRLQECLPANCGSLSCRPDRVLLLRARTQGYGHAVERILRDIETGGLIPESLVRIAGGGAHEEGASGADDILLSKAANEEQIRLAQKLQRSSCVLVQGPPGTGKTHTIANLIGHLLSEGKSVLVTAHTSKALRVLRDMVAKPLRPLCISVLDHDSENREVLDRSVEEIAHRLSEADATWLTEDARALKEHRLSLLREASQLHDEIFAARLAECSPVATMGVSKTLQEAARFVQEHGAVHGWLPGPVTPEVPPPLSHTEFCRLYQSHALLSLQDEADLEHGLPPSELLMGASELATLLVEHARSSGLAARDHAELWEDVDPPLTAADLDPIIPSVRTAANLVRETKGWWLEVIRAGQVGGEVRAIWEELADMVDKVSEESDAARRAVLNHDPEIAPSVDPEDSDESDAATLSEMIEHFRGGGTVGIWTKTTRRHWHRLIDRMRVARRPPETREQFEALHELARLKLSRNSLRTRWERQVAAIGGPTAASLGPQPERGALAIAAEIRTLLSWYHDRAAGVMRNLEALGFQWHTLLSASTESGELGRLRQAFAQQLETLVLARRDRLRMGGIGSRLEAAVQSLQPFAASPVTQRLQRALQEGDAGAYVEAARCVARLTPLIPVFEERRRNLARLAAAAPAFADAIRRREPPHDQATPPSEVLQAWTWRQLHDELERRAALPLNGPLARSVQVQEELRCVTTDLIERRAWAAMKSRVGPPEQAALEGYVTCLRKMTKSGRGRRDAALMSAARAHLAVARKSVPVWIMPLTRVYESLFRREGIARFDVVIIDEASQSDVSALAALYLGRTGIIVGDEEQVTPTPFADLDRAQRLIVQNLEGVPNRELYDPETSVYHLARAFFPDRILLRETFRSVPEIIQFSNTLSYDGEIKPLRDAQSSPVKPALVAHRVACTGSGRVNQAEAEEIAALLAACLEQREYDLNDTGEPTTYGVISLVGDEQAQAIEKLLRQHLPPAEFERRRIICGNAAQFQGDERDVMFLSLVDAPPADGGMLPLRDFGPKELFRKRFNVAASRARNQMWVVHSMDPSTSLQPGDLRRRLLEHAMNPSELMKELGPRGEPAPTLMQRQVIQWLTQRGFNTVCGWRVGACRLGMVVSGPHARLAVECDGERPMGEDELRRDMERQATLERLGWSFVRVRGTLLRTDMGAAMQPVLEALERLGIKPQSPDSAPASDMLGQVRRRAAELRWMWRERPASPAANDGPRPAWRHAIPSAARTVVKPELVTLRPALLAPEEPPLRPLPEREIVVEVGDWVEFVLLESPGEPQLVNLITGPTDVEVSAFNESEPLARALLGKERGERSTIVLSEGTDREIEVRQIHKPHKHRRR